MRLLPPGLKALLPALASLGTGLLAPGPARADAEFLPPQQVYRYSAQVIDDELVINYEIAPGYYLYRDKLGFGSNTPGVTLGKPSLPVGEDHEDEYFGKQVIYRGDVKIGVDVKFDGPPRDFDLKLKLQGCADAGLCYPPQNWTTAVKWPGAAAVPAGPPAASAAAGNAASATGTSADSGPARQLDLRAILGRGSSPLSDADFLPVDRAFVFAAGSPRADTATLHWQIADGYYLYRDKIKVTSPLAGVTLGAPRMPNGQLEQDEYFGEQVVYYGELQTELDVSAPPGTAVVPLEITYQGCADAGLCYPPTRKQVDVQLGAGLPSGSTTPGSFAGTSAGTSAGAAAAAPNSVGTPSAGASDGRAVVRSEQDLLADKIRNGNLFAVLATFFGLGLLLALTPCVLPMIPILSGIIVGAGGDRPVTRGRAFALSLAYVLGMAVTYTIAGAAFAAAGQQAQAFFQKPWMIALFAALFVWLALGMFGLYNLEMPSALQSRLTRLSDRQRQGSLWGTALMGALSSLIVTACVAPPLVASLAVIGQSGNVLRGGAALFAMSLGMGAPLLLVGASAGQLLPKAGAWMETVKAVFGVMLLGVAVWMLGRLLPPGVTMFLWATLAFLSGFHLLTRGGLRPRGGADTVFKGVGALSLLYGVLLLVGALSGRSDPLQPLGPRAAGNGALAAHGGLQFRRIKTTADLDRELASVRASGQRAMFDFYADWCVSCKEMAKYTFPDPAVQRSLAGAVLLQADVTANDADDQALLRRFGILGPPTIMFFGPDGHERAPYRVVGFKDAENFSRHVHAALTGTAP
jgi:thiol:disulfide interchange protein DsbD